MAPALARGAARRPVLAPRVAPARLRAHRVPDHARRRLGGRLPEQHVPDVRGARLPQAAARRPLEPHVDRDVASRAAHRPRPRAHPLVPALALRRGERDRGRAPDPGLRAALDAPGARPRRGARRVALGARVAARARTARGADRRTDGTAPTSWRSRETSARAPGSRAPDGCRGVSRPTSGRTTRGRVSTSGGRSSTTSRSSAIRGSRPRSRRRCPLRTSRQSSATSSRTGRRRS